MGREFVYNAGAGLVIRPSQSLEDRGPGIVEHVKAVFERDWTSHFARNLLTKEGLFPQGEKNRNLKQPELRSPKDDKDGERRCNNPL